MNQLQAMHVGWWIMEQEQVKNPVRRAQQNRPWPWGTSQDAERRSCQYLRALLPDRAEMPPLLDMPDAGTGVTRVARRKSKHSNSGKKIRETHKKTQARNKLTLSDYGFTTCWSTVKATLLLPLEGLTELPWGNKYQPERVKCSPHLLYIP